MQVRGCYYIKGAELHSVEHLISYSKNIIYNILLLYYILYYIIVVCGKVCWGSRNYISAI